MPKRRTKTLAVIGSPIDHSLSPIMQNAAIQKLGISAIYKKILVNPNQLKGFMKGMAQRLDGFNITIPHKEKILPYLDFIIPNARLIGAVNTVLNHKGKLIGFNTDGSGYLEALREDKDMNPVGSNVTILGSGGAARSLSVALALSHARKIILANRTVSRAQKLVQHLKRHIKRVQFSYSNLNGKNFDRILSNTDLLINTTSVGMYQTSFENFPWQHLNPNALVSDIVYTPLKTPFLKEASKRGHSIHTGEGMLVHQGALSLEIWTGRRPDTELMHSVILRELQG